MPTTDDPHPAAVPPGAVHPHDEHDSLDLGDPEEREKDEAEREGPVEGTDDTDSDTGS